MKKLKEMSIEDLKKNLDILENEATELSRERDSLLKSFQKKMTTIRKINEIIDERTLTIDNYEKLLDLNPETKIKREMRDEMLSQWNLRSEGYYLDTEQVAIKITLYHSDDETLHATYDGIKKLLHLIKPLKDGGKCFTIFEKTLCAFGVYHLKIDKGVHQVIKTVRGRESVQFSSDNLMATLKYIQKNHYYTGTPDKYTLKKVYAWRKKIKNKPKGK